MIEKLNTVERLENEVEQAHKIYDLAMNNDMMSPETKHYYNVWQKLEKELQGAYVSLTRALIKQAVRERLGI